MDQSLQARIEARLAKQRVMQQSSLTATQLQHQSNYGMIGSQLPMRPSQQIINSVQQTSTLPSAQNPAVQVVTNNLTETNNQYGSVTRDLAQTRTKLLSLERQTVTYENELKQKDNALRRTLAEATGERSSLVEALGEARASNDALRIELDRKDDIISKQETRINKISSDYQEMQAKFIKMQSEAQSIQFDSKYLKDQIQMMDTKCSITNAENQKLVDEVNQLREATLENRVVKNKIAQLEHEYNSVSAKYRAECENNTNIRAEFVQLKQEYHQVLSKFQEAQDGYSKYAHLCNKYDETLKQLQDLLKQKRSSDEELEELRNHSEQLEKQFLEEKNAINTLSVYFKQVTSNLTVDRFEPEINQIKKQGHIEDTVCFSSFSPILLRVKQIIEALKQAQNDNQMISTNSNNLKKENQQLKTITDELKMRSDSFRESYERLSKSCEELTQESTEVKLALQQKDQILNKLQCENQLALQQLIQICGKDMKESEPNVLKYLQTAQAMVQRQQKQIEQQHEELEVFAMRVTSVDQQNQNYLENQQQTLRDLEQYKIKLNTVKEAQNKQEIELKQNKQTLSNVQQFIQMLLRFVNYQDRQKSLLTQQSLIGNVLIQNYLIEQQNVVKKRPNKLRKVVYAIIFVSKLKKQAQIYNQVKQLEKQSIVAHQEQFAAQVSQIINPHIVQSGDMVNGLLNLNINDQRQLVNKVLNQFLSQTVVYCFGNSEQINIQTGSFNLIKNGIQKVHSENLNKIGDLQVQNQQVMQLNNQLGLQNETFVKENKNILDALNTREMELLKLKQGIDQFYVEIEQYQLLQQEVQSLTNRLQTQEEHFKQLNIQLASSQVDIQTYQNEVSRLTDALNQSDKLIRQVQQKFEIQIQSQMQMKELISQNENTLRQRDSQIDSLNMMNKKILEDQKISQNALEEMQVTINNLNEQILQREKLIQDIQIQLEKESRLRLIGETQIQRQQTQTLQMNSVAPRIPKYETNYSYKNIEQQDDKPKQLQVTKYMGAKTEIRDLINQLNESLGDEI
ncbi:Conserved_hypothetical protein [Hexamita inflata]|uniref:Uncharacterized protein n=1 Tax=Hexamita inflata TaxID=28002 RepID=A0AA86UV59_9EUKA|nr:Conserved hypothetical protein [Hexamita inflata]CAI9959547.1 Conserved hypothetical protein [Hexamita inflata]